jgi:hypothetical protein
MVEVDPKTNPKEREVDCEPKNQWNLKDLCDTRPKCERTKERPEELTANKPIVNDCVPIVSQKSNIVSQITSRKRDQENSIHFLCVIEAEKVRKKANAHGSFAQIEVGKTLPIGATKEGRCGVPLLEWEGRWAT